ncbi:RNA polymerase sigma factor SigJ [Streptomyces sp. NBC_01216]|uniref:RNA polymerase sigma factor SigJ n=1 Tax=Streptomyces sp. NBC_01216 TaxID=2903778 RepID=UPI002E107249|nr:RNA polymerase sigma factor SigJ [Streptomyces sp. NBC_01216]
MADHAVFERHRRRLWGIAYRITSSVSDTEDVLQDAWLRWQALPDDRALEPRAYLTTVVSRICYDRLTSARARRETYVGPWLPEPLVAAREPAPGPEEHAALDESVGFALLTVLERLTPAERTAFVLHDVFEVPFPEVAEAVGRTPDAVRALASRARRRVRDERPRQTVDRAEHRRTVEAFLAAVTAGDLDTLVATLDPDVVWRSDGGGAVGVARVPVLGSEKVARFAGGLVRGLDPAGTRVEVLDVNGAPGIVFADPASARAAVLAFTVHAGRITGIDCVVNPDKLRHLGLLPV